MNSLHPIWLVVFSFLLALVPVFVGLFTSYIKVSVVLGMLKNGLGAQQVPGNLVVMALSLAISFYVMSPAISQTADLAAGMELPSFSELPAPEALEKSTVLLKPWRDFMRAHTGSRELKALLLLACDQDKESPHCLEAGRQSDLAGQPHEPQFALGTLAAAFVLTELKQAFAMGFVLLLPFLVVDLIVANLLAGMGMFMVSPALISLPLKLILFIMCDGWLLLTRGLISSYL